MDLGGNDRSNHLAVHSIYSVLALADFGIILKCVVADLYGVTLFNHDDQFLCLLVCIKK